MAAAAAAIVADDVDIDVGAARGNPSGSGHRRCQSWGYGCEAYTKLCDASYGEIANPSEQIFGHNPRHHT